MDYDQDKVDEVVLALLYLTLHDVSEHGGRAWKGHAWEVLDRLHARGLIDDPRSKAKSVTLSPEAIKKSKATFQSWFAAGTESSSE